MDKADSITLAKPVSELNYGLILRFSPYVSGAIQKYGSSYRFVPKTHVGHALGTGFVVVLAPSKGGYYATKYMYLTNTALSGNDDNSMAGTGSNGIAYDNTKYRLTGIFGI